MKRLFKSFLLMMLTLACIFACASCGTENGGEDLSDDNYRIRFVYSYSAKVENTFDRIEYLDEIVTVQSFYISKDNRGITDEIREKINNLSYHGFSFIGFYTEWDVETQTGIEGTEYVFDNQPIKSDITLFCDRGNLAGHDIYWELTPVDAEQGEVESYVLSLSGSGNMFDFQDANEIDVPWFKYSDKITSLVVSDGVTSIGRNSFCGFKNLTNIDIPDSIKSIGSSSFEGVGITRFVAPASLEAIESNAFCDTALKNVILNEGLIYLADRAFHGSNKIESVTIPSTLEEIRNAAFHPGTKNGKTKSHALSKVYYNGTAREFNKINIQMDNAWLDEFSTIYYYLETPDDFGTPGAEKITGNFWHLASDGITPVQYCVSLKYTLSSNSEIIHTILVPVEPLVDADGNTVFDEDGVPKVEGIITAAHVREQNKISYNNYTFAGFSGSKTIVPGDVITNDRTYTCNRGKILSPDGGIKWHLTNKTVTVYKDADTQARIEEEFASRIADEGGIVLDDVEMDVLAYHHADRKGTNYLAEIGQIRARNLSGIKLSEDEITALVADRVDKAFRIWDFVATIDTMALWADRLDALNDKVSAVVVEDGVEYIGRFTFAGIAKLDTIILPSSVVEIHPNAFDGCSKLKYVYYDGSIVDSCPSLADLTGFRGAAYSKIADISSYESLADKTGRYWMINVDENGKESRVTWEFTSNGQLTLGGDESMFDYDSVDKTPWFSVKDSVTSLAFVDNITGLGENIVNGYKTITSISLPTNLRRIPTSSIEGIGVFDDPSNYNNGAIIINGHLLKVSSDAEDIFETQTGLITIAGGAFENCSNVDKLYIARTVQYINPGAFEGCEIRQVFVDGDDAIWDLLKGDAKLDEANIYFKSDSKPDVDNMYWFMCGNEYVIWGCVHVWGEYVDDNNASCTENATKTANCLVDGCDKTNVLKIDDSMLDHSFNKETHLCDMCETPDPNYSKN